MLFGFANSSDWFTGNTKPVLLNLDPFPSVEAKGHLILFRTIKYFR